MILTYHELVGGVTPYLYAVHVRLFEEHLALVNGPIGGSASAITFDDGLREHGEIAAPILEKAGVRGIFFVSPHEIGSTRYMSRSDLITLAGAGHSIQSHGWSHQLLPLCPPEVLRSELVRSRATLEDWLGREVTDLAVPGGAYNCRVLRAAAEAGYTRVYTSDPWLRSARREGVLTLGRLMIRNSTSVERLRKLLATEDQVVSWPRLTYLGRCAARRILGISLYHKMWSVLARMDAMPSSISE